MFVLGRPPLDRHLIDAGRVYCPRRERDIDVEHCASCSHLVAFDDGASPPSIRCRPDRPLPAFLLRVL